MDPLTIGLITGGAQLASGLFSSETSAQNTQEQIQAQEEMQQQSEQFNAAQAQITRDWQTQMSNTAYQRASADMKAAGLNPMMMASGSMNASTPSGSTASTSTPTVPMPQNKSPLAGIGDAVNSAINAATAVKTQEKLTEEIANLKVAESNTAANTALTQQKTKTEEWESDKRSSEASSAKYDVAGHRLGSQEAIAIQDMPPWLRNTVVQGGYLGKNSAQAIKPISDLIGDFLGGKLAIAKKAALDRQYPD